MSGAAKTIQSWCCVQPAIRLRSRRVAAIRALIKAGGDPRAHVEVEQMRAAKAAAATLRVVADEHEWNEPDRVAMREFIRLKVLPSMARVMDTVRDGQAALLKSEMVAGASARHWRAGEPAEAMIARVGRR
jgi:hypothetical protein